MLFRSYGTVRPIPSDIKKDPIILPKYDLTNLPTSSHLLDDNFLLANIKFEKEAELYAFLINSFKHQSRYSSETLKAFNEINQTIFNIPFKDICHNVILECLITPHIQEELDILICNQSETHFLIIEVKKGNITQKNVDQAKKYIELLNILFPNAEKIAVNIIGLEKDPSIKNDNKFVKTVRYQKDKGNLVKFSEIT